MISTTADILKLLGDTTRIRILHLLKRMEFSAGEISEMLEMNPSAVSNQLSLLKKSGMVTIRKSGNRIFYNRKLQEHGELLPDAIFERYDKEGLFRYEEQSVESVLGKRRLLSLEHFNEYPDEKNLPGESSEVLLAGFMGLLRGMTVADLGCGGGELSGRLALSGNWVTGVDNSPKRIEAARRRWGGDNPRFVIADMESTGLADGGFDLALLGMSLHHSARPVEVIREASRLLADNGRLLLWDLEEHTHGDFIDTWGDYWPGFNGGQLKEWLTEAGLNIIWTDNIQTDRKYRDLNTLIIIASKAEGEGI